MTIKLKPITETSWLVIGDADDIRIGLLTETREKYILMVKGEKKHFLNRTDVNTFFKEDVFNSVVEDVPATPDKRDYFINGFPVRKTITDGLTADSDSLTEVIIKGNSLPLFSKKPSSKVYYAAGYYCIHFPKVWVPAHCPKYSTLESYEHAGPYKTELEMKTALKKLRHEK